MSWVRTWLIEMTWMEENGSFVRVGHRDTSSSVSVSRACLSVSPQTKTSFCSVLQEHTTGKVMWPTDRSLYLEFHVLLIGRPEENLCSVIWDWMYCSQKMHARGDEGLEIIFQMDPFLTCPVSFIKMNAKQKELAVGFFVFSIYWFLLLCLSECCSITVQRRFTTNVKEIWEETPVAANVC